MYHLIYHKRNSAFFRICTLNNCILIQKICILNTANLYKNTEDLYFKYRKSVLKYRLLTTLAHHKSVTRNLSLLLYLGLRVESSRCVKILLCNIRLRFQEENFPNS